ncbi:hypothetical protein PybrP1_000026 [[Pythium] brassicae (nom. inval.)]|nr:hypothetical protein PybrP1_000026 [[Pythium] brassicae (nom. inval.)]
MIVVRKFAGFVDDSTLFVRNAGDLPRCMKTLKRFEVASGLRVQPIKCQGIWLNTARGETAFEDLPFLSHGQTTRYLGVQVGTGALTEILRSIFLPLAAYTALYFAPSEQQMTELRDLHDKYLTEMRLNTLANVQAYPSLHRMPFQDDGRVYKITQATKRCDKFRSEVTATDMQEFEEYAFAYLGAKATNNAAEYAAMTMGLRAAAASGVREVEIYGDSQLIARQMGGQAGVKHSGLKKQFVEARDLVKGMRRTSMAHTFRVWNTMADSPANIAMDEKKSRDSSTIEAPQNRSLRQQLQERMAQDLEYKPQLGGTSQDEAKRAAAREN